MFKITTKLQRNKHIKKILKILAQNEDFIEDKCGNLISIDGIIRYKPKKSVLRKEKRFNNKWITIYSAYFKDIEIRGNNINIMKRII